LVTVLPCPSLVPRNRRSPGTRY